MIWECWSFEKMMEDGKKSSSNLAAERKSPKWDQPTIGAFRIARLPADIKQ
jgi:hypothetical protein